MFGRNRGGWGFVCIFMRIKDIHPSLKTWNFRWHYLFLALFYVLYFQCFQIQLRRHQQQDMAAGLTRLVKEGDASSRSNFRLNNWSSVSNTKNLWNGARNKILWQTVPSSASVILFGLFGWGLEGSLIPIPFLNPLLNRHRVCLKYLRFRLCLSLSVISFMVIRSILEKEKYLQFLCTTELIFSRFA